MFVDEVEIQVQAGKGGDGSASFRREKYVPRGGPDGGDGGDGGSVILEAREGVNSLAALAHRKHWTAEDGQPGGSAQCHGRSGKDLLIAVPAGTIVMDAEQRFVIKDLAQDGDRVTVAVGGKGGKGNVHFKSATNRAPREFVPGGEGQHRAVRLELKVIADIGLIGKPNAGKSTLLSRLSRGTARDRSLSLHHEVSAPRPRADRFRPLLHPRRHSGADRRGPRRRTAWDTNFSATSSGRESWSTSSSPNRPTARSPWTTTA